MLLAVGKSSSNLTHQVIGSITRRSLHITRNFKHQFFTEIQSVKEQQPIIKCRNREFLPGSNFPGMPEILSTGMNKYFKAISFNEPNHENLTSLGRDIYDITEDYIKQNYNCILIKNLHIKEAKEFDALVEGFDYIPMNYESGIGLRDKVVGKVYTASEELKEFTIEPHNEMAYLNTFPQRVSIYRMTNKRL